MQNTWAISDFTVLLLRDANYASNLALGTSGERATDTANHRNNEGARQHVVELYDAIRPQLYRYLINRRVAPQDVEEVVQESFLRLFQHVVKGGNEENLRAWIYQVAHNLAENMRKTRGRLVEGESDVWIQIRESAQDRAAGPEEQLLEREQASILDERLTRLTQLQRDCLNLRVEGFRYREIATILHVGTSTVAGSLRNAIAKLVKESS